MFSPRKPDPRSEANDLYMQSMENEKAGDLDEAIAKLERANELINGRQLHIRLALDRLYKRTCQYEKLRYMTLDDDGVYRYSLFIGDYETALRALEQISLERENANKISDERHSGCIPGPAQYSHFMFQLALCALDGYGDYERAIVAIDRGLRSIFQVPMDTPLERVPCRFNQPEGELQTWDLVTLFISCVATGKTERADRHRKILTNRLDASKPAYEQALKAINKTTLTRQEQVELMELVAKANRDSCITSLIRRALVMRTCHGIIDKDAIKESFLLLMHRYDDDMQEGFALARIKWLEENADSDVEVASAKLDYADLLLKRQGFSGAKRFLLPLITHADRETQIAARRKIIDCCRRMNDETGAMEHQEALRELTSEGLPS